MQPLEKRKKKNALQNQSEQFKKHAIGISLICIQWSEVKDEMALDLKVASSSCLAI